MDETAPKPQNQTLESAEEQVIRNAMKTYNGNLTLVAKALKISRPTLPASASEPDRFSAVIIAKAEDLVWGNGVMVDVSSDYKGTEKAILEVYREYSEEQNGTFVEAAQNGYVKDLNNLSLQPVKMAMRLLELFMLLSVLISLLGLVAMS